MGLDWCLQDKLKPGHEELAEQAEREVAHLTERIEESWQAFRKEKGEGASDPWSDPLLDEWRALEETEALYATVEEAKKARAAHYTSPMEELGAPRVGIDEEATAWAEENWKEWDDDYRVGGNLRKPPTLEEYLTANQGKYVPALVKNKEGLGACTGIMVGAETFRGKIIGYAGEIIGEQLANDAYEDRDTASFLLYGNQLLEAGRGYAASHGLEWVEEADREDPRLQATNDDNLWSLWYVFQGAKWCIFWASRGFSLHAWY